MSAEIIMGIDPGTKVTGFGILKKENGVLSPLDFGCIRPPYNFDLHRRYLIIFNAIEALILKYSPSALAIETQFVNKNAQSAIKLGMARGVSIIAAAKNNIPIFEYAPKKAKLAVVGNGGASKEQIQKMLKVLLNLRGIDLPADAADALAIALCHSHQNPKLGKQNVRFH